MSQFVCINIVPMQVHIITKDSELKKIVAQAMKQKYVAYDSETESFEWLTDKICMVQIGFDDKQYLVDASRCSLLHIKPLMESPLVVKIIHGSIFDCTWLKWEYGIDTINIYDTMQAEKIMLGVVIPHKPQAGMTKAMLDALKPKFSASLNWCLHRRNLPDKFEFEPFEFGKAWTANQIKYSARDIEFLYTLMVDQDTRIRQLNLENVLDLENAVAEIFYNMSVRGFTMDVEGWLQYADDNEAQYNAAVKSLKKYADINWQAPGQTCKFFGVKYIAELEALDPKTLDKKKQAAYESWKVARQFNKAVTTFGRVWIEKNVHKGKVHCGYTQIVNTGRCSSDSPNLQQIPVKKGFKHRSFFIPSKGHSFAIADFSGQELAIMAIGSGETIWLETLRAGKDLHQKCADLMTHQAGREIPRRMAKTLNFTMGYGGGKLTVMTRLKQDYDIEISEDDAQELINVYFATFPKLRKWLNDNGALGVRHGMTYSFPPFNRRRVLALETEDWRKKNIGKNSPVQGTGADMTKLSMLYIDKELKGKGVIIHQLHDELIVEAPTKYVKQAAQIMKYCMNEACEAILGEPLSAPDVIIQTNWAKKS